MPFMLDSRRKSERLLLIKVKRICEPSKRVVSSLNDWVKILYRSHKHRRLVVSNQHREILPSSLTWQARLNDSPRRNWGILCWWCDDEISSWKNTSFQAAASEQVNKHLFSNCCLFYDFRECVHFHHHHHSRITDNDKRHEREMS